MHEVIRKACAVDHAGEAVLEFLRLMPDQDLVIVASQNARELIAITAWYLWWNRMHTNTRMEQTSYEFY